MTPAEALEQYRGMMAAIGEAVLVRRYAGKGAARAVAAEASVLARIVSYKPAQIVGAVVQGDRMAIVLVDPDAVVPVGKVALSTLLPLSTNDILVVGGVESAIQAVDDRSRRLQGVLIALELQVRG